MAYRLMQRSVENVSVCLYMSVLVLSDTIATVSLSTVPGPSRQVCPGRF